MKKLLLSFLLCPLLGFAQQVGTHFEHGTSWAEVKKKAKQENKYLFVDCFTTWCGPCKYMAGTVFPQQKVGDFFNKNFVNVKVQIDQTAQDNEEVKNWYDDAQKISKEYSVRAYPTFLIFSPQGELVHQIVGGGEADDFMARAGKALKPETQYFTLVKKYKAGEKSPEFLKNLAYAAADAYDEDIKDKAGADYLAGQNDLYTKDNLKFLGEFTASSKNKGFEAILKHPEKVDAVLGKGTANKLLSAIVMKEEIYPALKGSTAESIDFNALSDKIKVKYPSVDISKEIALLQVNFYQRKKDWPKFRASVSSYMEKYGSDADANLLNSLAWAVFESCNDPACITEALAWSKSSIDKTMSKEPALIDTYANLLHKLGRTQEAITWEEKAIELLPAAEKSAYNATVDKMKKGEKTW
jgi:thioredoxin-related protein